jgi:hypothetical protein
MTKWQKKTSWQKNGQARDYLPQFRTAIFLPLYLFAILLVVRLRRKGRAGSFAVPLVLITKGGPQLLSITKSTLRPSRI